MTRKSLLLAGLLAALTLGAPATTQANLDVVHATRDHVFVGGIGESSWANLADGLNAGGCGSNYSCFAEACQVVSLFRCERNEASEPSYLLDRITKGIVFGFEPNLPSNAIVESDVVKWTVRKGCCDGYYWWQTIATLMKGGKSFAEQGWNAASGQQTSSEVSPTGAFCWYGTVPLYCPYPLANGTEMNAAEVMIQQERLTGESTNESFYELGVNDVVEEIGYRLPFAPLRRVAK